MPWHRCIGDPGAIESKVSVWCPLLQVDHTVCASRPVRGDKVCVREGYCHSSQVIVGLV